MLAGRNYGWPLLTYGRNYGTGTRIGDEGPKAGFEQPLKVWMPMSVAPSGMAFLTSDRYPGWQGSLFVGTLRGQSLLRLELDGNGVVKEEELLASLTAAHPRRAPGAGRLSVRADRQRRRAAAAAAALSLPQATRPNHHTDSPAPSSASSAPAAAKKAVISVSFFSTTSFELKLW